MSERQPNSRMTGELREEVSKHAVLRHRGDHLHPDKVRYFNAEASDAAEGFGLWITCWQTTCSRPLQSVFVPVTSML